MEAQRNSHYNVFRVALQVSVFVGCSPVHDRHNRDWPSIDLCTTKVSRPAIEQVGKKTLVGHQGSGKMGSGRYDLTPSFSSGMLFASQITTSAAWLVDAGGSVNSGSYEGVLRAVK
jgi:hypothetical protein